MREILFKAKRIDNGEWIIGNFVYSEDAEEGWKAIIIPTFDSNMFTKGGSKGDLGFENWHRVDKDTICQYTGLTDKNGNKIWENDVVRYYDDLADMNKEDLVKWNETHASFIRLHISKMGLQYLYIDECIANRSEVIGNIFDNPELVERN